VEAFVEYAAPAEKWHGPEPLMAQFSARDPEKSFSLVSTPEWRSEGAPAPTAVHGEGRAPAQHSPSDIAAAALEGEGSVRKIWKSDELRTRLAAFAEAISDPNAPLASGCLYPVRVRLLKADGSVLEKAGCRTSKGWPKLASALVADAF
jgi:hypothetical protein